MNLPPITTQWIVIERLLPPINTRKMMLQHQAVIIRYDSPVANNNFVYDTSYNSGTNQSKNSSGKDYKIIWLGWILQEYLSIITTVWPTSYRAQSKAIPTGYTKEVFWPQVCYLCMWNNALKFFIDSRRSMDRRHSSLDPVARMVIACLMPLALFCLEMKTSCTCYDYTLLLKL